MLSLVYSILKSTETHYSFKKGPNLTKLTASVLEFFYDKPWGNIIESLNTASIVDAIDAQKDIQADIEEFFNELLSEKGNRLIVFVDELDRCNPSFAVKLLERIKHYFSNDRILKRLFDILVDTKALNIKTAVFIKLLVVDKKSKWLRTAIS